MSAIKTSFGVIVALVALLILFPIFLWMAGISVFPFGAGSTSGSGKSGVVLRSSDGGVHWDGVSFQKKDTSPAPAPAQVLHVIVDPPSSRGLRLSSNGVWSMSSAKD
jgi:hypothetical protein